MENVETWNADQKEAIEQYQSLLDDALKSLEEAILLLETIIVIRGDADFSEVEAYNLTQYYRAIAGARNAAWTEDP